MKMGQRFRIIMLLMTMLVMVSPMASAQSTPQVIPVEETPVVVETPEGAGETPEASTPVDEVVPTEEIVDETTPEPTEIVDETTPEATETETPADPVDVIDDVLPESTPGLQTQSRGLTIQATRTLVITVETSDGAAVPAGTEVCVWNVNVDWCQDWAGAPLTFQPDSTRSEFWIDVPGESIYSDAEGVLSVPSGQTVEHTVTLQKKATAEISLAPDTVPAGTRVCLDSEFEYSCEDWTGSTLTFLVSPGVVQYEVYTTAGSGFADAFGSFTVGAGQIVQQVITLEAPGTVNVTLVTADGGPLPDGFWVCAYPSEEGCDFSGAETRTFSVTPGEISYEVDMWDDSRYQDITGTITVAPGEIVDLTVELQPKGPSTLRVYVTTEDGGAVPDGTQVCVDMADPDAGDPVVDLCQTISGSYVSFTLDRGDVDITVTPPAGSGYASETDTFWTELGETTRVVFELERTEPLPTGVVEINVSTADGTPLDEFDASVCLHLGEFELLTGCGSLLDSTVEADGSVTFSFESTAGAYNFIALSDLTGYGIVTGTVTVTADETTRINVVLPLLDSQDQATLIVDVVTIDGSPVAEGVMVCALDISSGIEDGTEIEDFCRPWTGTPESFTLPPSLAVYLAAQLDGDNYVPTFPQLVFLSPGETREVTITLYPYDLETTIMHTVSDEAPQSGDTVTYTIRAYGQSPQFMTMAAYEPWIDFQIDNVLPAELSDISVSCSGTYYPSVPGPCYELENGVLSILGEYGMGDVFDITITVTGTIVGEPGTVVPNTACVDQIFYGEGTFRETTCATALLTIAQADEVTPTPTVPVTPEPTDPATPEVTPSPTATVTPDVTPSPTDPAPTSPATPDPTAPAGDPTATPAGDPVVTALPSTGTTGAGQSTLLFATAIAAFGLLLAGCAVQLRGRNR